MNIPVKDWVIGIERCQIQQDYSTDAHRDHCQHNCNELYHNIGTLRSSLTLTGTSTPVPLVPDISAVGELTFT
jgi:hypothetical protein